VEEAWHCSSRPRLLRGSVIGDWAIQNPEWKWLSQTGFSKRRSPEQGWLASSKLVDYSQGAPIQVRGSSGRRVRKAPGLHRSTACTS